MQLKLDGSEGQLRYFKCAQGDTHLKSSLEYEMPPQKAHVFMVWSLMQAELRDGAFGK
jgi:hypothetical protein